jgi:hypothetical protein
MPDIKKFRREWSSDHKKLRALLSKGESLQEARNLFLELHAVLHRLRMSNLQVWSYADQIFSDLEEDEFRLIPGNAEHSLIWILWHIARIEDITMNILVADKDQIYLKEGWKERIDSPIDYTGNQITQEDLKMLTNSVNPVVLLEYRDAVGRGTQNIVKTISEERLAENVSQLGLDRIVTEGAVLPESVDLLAYWGKKTIFQLLLMPPTRHMLVHLNEANYLRKKIRKSG